MKDERVSSLQESKPGPLYRGKNNIYNGQEIPKYSWTVCYQSEWRRRRQRRTRWGRERLRWPSLRCWSCVSLSNWWNIPPCDNILYLKLVDLVTWANKQETRILWNGSIDGKIICRDVVNDSWCADNDDMFAKAKFVFKQGGVFSLTLLNICTASEVWIPTPTITFSDQDDRK